MDVPPLKGEIVSRTLPARGNGDHRLSHAKPMVERLCLRIPPRLHKTLPGSAAAAGLRDLSAPVRTPGHLPFQGRLFYSFTCNSRMGLFCRMDAEMAADAPTQRAKWAIT